MYRVYYYITVYAEASKCVNVARCREKRKKKNGLCLHSNHTADIMAMKSAHLARSAGSAGADYINNLTKKKKRAKNLQPTHATEDRVRHFSSDNG